MLRASILPGPSRLRPHLRRGAVLLALGGLAATLTMSSAQATPEPGAIVGANAPGTLPNRYIVVLKDAVTAQSDVARSAQTLAGRFGGTVDATYSRALRGFSVSMPEAAARRLAKEPSVAYVEQDRKVRKQDTQTNPPSWGLDRIDQLTPSLNNAYTYPRTGSGVTVYVIDTGVRITHANFGGRARHGYDFIEDDPDASDCDGHGTHVAGTVAGSAYGVAKGASVVAVRVLDCFGDGTIGTVMSGVDWVTANAVRPAVANVSLGAPGTSAALEGAVQRSIASGVTYAVAAGNFDENACGYTPARTPQAITIGATDRADIRASFSNFGGCLDMFAPGTEIVSAGHLSDTGVATMDGTSMATPHVAGAAALILAQEPDASAAQVTARLVGDSVTGVLDTVGSPDSLLQVRSVPAAYTPLSPARLLDTRDGTGGQFGPVGPGQSISVQVTGVGGVPATGVGAVVLNLTGTQPTAATFVTAYPSGESVPLASNLNLNAGQTIPNLVIVKVGAGGQIDLYNANGTVHLLADVAGWMPTTADFEPLTPARVLDTRNGTGVPAGPVGPDESVSVQVTGVGGVPASGVGAVVLNVTGVLPTSNTYVTAYPNGQSVPLASNLNLNAGTVGANLVIVKVGTGGRINLYNALGSTHLLADVAGWMPVSPEYNPLNPARLLDTRNGTGAPAQPVGPGQTVSVQVTGVGGVPATGVGAVVLNVTGTQPSSGTFVTAYPNGQPLPLASNLNLVAGQTIPNLVIVKVGTGGRINLYNAVGTVHLLADVAGWMPVEPPTG